MPRVYTRRFDHEEAAHRLAAGEKLTALAREYGVTLQAVLLAVERLNDPELRAKQNAYRRARRTTVCEMCGGPAMKNIGSKLKHGDGRVLCRACRFKTMRKRFRFDDTGVLVAVRCSSLSCANGERWQPPEHFPGGTRFRDVRAKGIHGSCRACQTAARADYRARHRDEDRAYQRQYKRARKTSRDGDSTRVLHPA